MSIHPFALHLARLRLWLVLRPGLGLGDSEDPN